MSPIFTVRALWVLSPAVHTSITEPLSVLMTAAPLEVPAYRRSVPILATEATKREGMPS